MEEFNLAFVDGQNLHLGLKNDGWKIDLKKFRVFLNDQFKVKEAYYFLGFISEEEQELYNSLQKAGFIVIFREHSSALKGQKKGNVDADIIFEVMKSIADKVKFDNIVLVSGDGDYKKLVDYLIKKNIFKRLLFPTQNHSSLYKKIGNKFYYYLKDAKKKIQYKKRGS